MKDLKTIRYQQPVYLNNWAKCKQAQMVADFQELEIIKDSCINILFASYGYGDYSGQAFVLFEKLGKLYEVNGQHCSCYGLEDQWEPEETTLEALKHRLENGDFGKSNSYDNNFADELKEFLGI